MRTSSVVRSPVSGGDACLGNRRRAETRARGLGRRRKADGRRLRPAVLRLADLLAEESFGLELLSGGPEAATREVRGAHAVEVDAPARWLGPDWIMLTTGVRLRGQRRRRSERSSRSSRRQA